MTRAHAHLRRLLSARPMALASTLPSTPWQMTSCRCGTWQQWNCELFACLLLFLSELREGHGVQATVRCLADNGRLLEIGKYDILKGTPLSMRPMLRNVAFEGIDLDRITNDPCNITEVGTYMQGSPFWQRTFPGNMVRCF